MSASQSFRAWRVDDELRRTRMVEEQLVSRGLSNERVLWAMSEVPREAFVPDTLRNSAYDDGALPIGSGQTISQPFTVAFMCEALRPQATDCVLEVGTGSGYGAAVLSRLVRQVHTIERIPELAATARDRLQQLGYDNVHVHLANGTLGLPEKSPFDGIVVTAAAEHVPQTYIDQLVDGGRIVIPIGQTLQGQIMCRFTRNGNALAKENLGAFAFVPLIGEHGWHESEVRSGSW